ncbi:ketosteroid isomerase-related protein [Yoonia sediminilitoris]|uniref:Steroid delta-isomerase-like uncharacterized protein n=1 Tax=Yoonia sediminilitoris TaxID=1286148 RepID=A0A2T6KM17_9RHOB|nr:ketosteroid isomerase-related protein [Yoonia sediminilitoris]PUB17221.1 steroid delta-isomerase-like uncharacterized protein [Yoonia sediminilitoris]RCW97516.1 steroid delta-isomerase-like uncharacterized protein [Yoonia sediminilitoris]
MTTKEIITAYYDAFNRGDTDAMCALLASDVAHHVNEGSVRHGIDAFREFSAHMTACYKETLTDIVIFVEGDRAAAEFTVNGAYLADDDGLPPANGQTYKLPGGAFFALKDGKITRVTTYYNLSDWIAQVAG